MTRAERRVAVKHAKGNRTIHRLAMFWRAVRDLVRSDGPIASGWAALGTEATENGPARMLLLKGRWRVRDGWCVPTLLIDALLRPELVHPFWPNVQIKAEVLVVAQHQQVRQVVDKSFSRRSLDTAGENCRDAKYATRNLRKLHAVFCREARRYAGCRVLVVAQQLIETALLGHGNLPGNVELAHHNAIAGRYEWGPRPDRPGVAALIVVGRTMPPPIAVERMAEALTGVAIEPLAGWYQRVDALRETADGSTTVTDADRHPHPIAEAVRWSICEGELIQIIGRARGVNRDHRDPVEVLVLTDVPLPVPLSETMTVGDLTLSPRDLMLAAGGVALENATDAAAEPQALQDKPCCGRGMR